MNSGILKGMRVLDLSRMLSGPYATMLLADHGAEVIKVESLEGDSSRRSGPFERSDKKNSWSGYFISLNRNKKSVCLNLKHEDDIFFFKELVKHSDVLVENFRPGVMRRLGLSFENLLQINPKLVYASISGFGSEIFGESPYKNWPSYDVVAQAMGGLISLTGYDEKTPVKVGPGIADIFSGSLLSFGIMASILKSREIGKGQLVEVAMYDAIVSMCERAIYQYDFTKIIPNPEGNGHPLLAPFGIYKAKDGFVAIGIVEDPYWDILKKIINLNEVLDDLKFGTISLRAKNRSELNTLVNNWTSNFKKKELIKLLGGKIPFGPVNNAKEIFEDTHVSNRGMLLKIKKPLNNGETWKIAGNPIKFLGFDALCHPPPTLDEHKKKYSSFLKFDELAKTKPIFQPQKEDYKCTIILKGGTKKEQKFDAISFSWLVSEKTYLICNLKKTQSIFLTKDYYSSVNFYFSKVSTKKCVNEDQLSLLNSYLSNKKISKKNFIYLGDEILLAVDT